VLRDLVPEMHETWDFPNPTQIKGQREVTTVPSQSLFMLNNELVVSTARALAVSLLESMASGEDRVQLAYRALFSREADADEAKAALGMLESLETPTDENDKESYRWATMIQALLGSAEFRYAW